jgi:hypothetical protein
MYDARYLLYFYATSDVCMIHTSTSTSICYHTVLYCFFYDITDGKVYKVVKCKKCEVCILSFFRTVSVSSYGIRRYSKNGVRRTV